MYVHPSPGRMKSSRVGNAAETTFHKRWHNTCFPIPQLFIRPGIPGRNRPRRLDEVAAKQRAFPPSHTSVQPRPPLSRVTLDGFIRTGTIIPLHRKHRETRHVHIRVEDRQSRGEHQP